MIIYTIGFTKKTARQFFDAIKAADIKMMIDVRLNNSSQLAGFSKGSDLDYFLSEICGCAYRYEPIFAPTKELMDGFKGNKLTIPQYEEAYSKIIADRNAVSYFMLNYGSYKSVCLLCSEDTADRCHRRVLAEIIQSELPCAEIVHL